MNIKTLLKTKEAHDIFYEKGQHVHRDSIIPTAPVIASYRKYTEVWYDVHNNMKRALREG